MAKYRQLQTRFWADPFIEGLTPEQKFFYIFLLTNPATKQCGIYEITIKTMAYQTGYTIEIVEKLLVFFEQHGKIKFSKGTSEICLRNFKRHNWTSSPKVVSCIKKELTEVKDPTLIHALYGIDTIPQKKEKEKQEEKQEEGHVGMFSFKNISNSNYFNDAKKICDFFGFDLEINPDKYLICIEFIKKIQKLDKLELFKEMFGAYIKYKKISGEKTHSLITFLGSKSDSFEDGGWNANNWTKKLENISKETTNKIQPGQHISENLKYTKWT